MSYTIANAHEAGDYTAKECELCDRVASKTIKVHHPKTGKIVSVEVCRFETRKEVLEVLENWG